MNDPKITKAFEAAIKKYFKGLENTESNKAKPDRKYNKKYFDGVEESVLKGRKS